MAEYTAVSLEDSDNLKPSTILHLAAKNGQLETLDSRLNNGANCNIKDNTGQSALHYAALNGHYNCCERLLQCPSLKVNAVNIKGMSPLHLAALKDHYEIIKLLKKHDAQVNLKDKQDHLPLHFAAMKGFHESCEALLSVSDDGCNARDSSGHSPLHYAVSAGSDECCRQFLQCSNVNVNIKSNSDDTPLHYAAKAGHQNICNMLIKAENIKVNAKNIHEMTPLHLAAQENHDAVIKLLVENGAQVNLKDKKSQIPLHLAAKKGFLKSCEALLTDVSDAGHKAQDFSGNSPLHYVASGGHGDCCQRLLQCLDVDVNIKNNSDVTPLHYAAKMGHQNICIILLQNQNIDVNAINEEEMSALHLAAEEGYDEIINLLVQNSADVNLQDKKSHIPLHYAAKKGYIDSCRALLSHDRNKQLNATLEHGKTPLMLAVIEGQYSCCAELKNADINIKDHKENTALHYAVTRGFKKTVEQLLRMGAHPNIENKKGTTPVLAAAGKALSDCLVCLVNSSVVAQEERADLNVVDKSNKNILHYAAERNAKDCLKFLFSLSNFKTDLDGEDEDGNTPLHIAITRGSVECAHILLKNGASPVKQDLGGMTPLHLAADKGYTSICEILLINDDVQVSQGNSKKETPLHLAARCGSLELCQNLLQNGALLSATDKNGQTALHFAAIKGNANVVKFLTEKGMPRWIKDNSGSTAMHLAASVGSLECCQLLVVSDKNSFFIADKNGRLPLDRAFEHKHDDVFKFLLLRLPYRNIQERKTRILDYTYEGLKTNRPAVVEAIIESSWWLSGFTGLNGHKCENFKELVKRHPDLALKLQDKCIKHSHSEVTYYFRFLEDNYYIPPVSGKIAQSPFDKESGKLREDAVQFIQDRLEWKKCHPVNLIVEHNLLQLLQHSLTKAWLRYKWKSFVSVIFLFLLVLELFFVISLTVFMESTSNWNYIEERCNITREQFCSLSETQTLEELTFTTDAPSGNYGEEGNIETLTWLPDNSTIMKLMKCNKTLPENGSSLVLLIITFIILLLWECNCIYRLRKEYLNVDNMMRLSSLLLTAVVIVPGGTCELHYHIRNTEQWECGIIALLVGWIHFISNLNQLPVLSISMPITETFLKRFLLVASYITLLIFVFAFTFHIQLRDQDAFGTVSQAMVKATVWMFSDLAYDDTFLNEKDPLVYPVFTNLLFLLFVTTISVFIANLFITRSTEKLESFRDKAILHQAASRCELFLKLDVCFPFFIEYRTRGQYKENPIEKGIHSIITKKLLMLDTEQGTKPVNSLELQLQEQNKQITTLLTHHQEEIRELRQQIVDLKHQTTDLVNLLSRLNQS